MTRSPVDVLSNACNLLEVLNGAIAYRFIAGDGDSEVGDSARELLEALIVWDRDRFLAGLDRFDRVWTRMFIGDRKPVLTTGSDDDESEWDPGPDAPTSLRGPYDDGPDEPEPPEEPYHFTVPPQSYEPTSIIGTVQHREHSGIKLGDRVANTKGKKQHGFVTRIFELEPGQKSVTGGTVRADVTWLVEHDGVEWCDGTQFVDVDKLRVVTKSKPVAVQGALF